MTDSVARSVVRPTPCGETRSDLPFAADHVYDVAIIGGGIIGCATAALLSATGTQNIVLIEKESDVSCGATGANTGILHAGYDPEPGSLKATLNREGFSIWPTLIRHLDIPYRQCGSLVVALDGTGVATVDELARRGVENGIRDLHVIDGPAAMEMTSTALNASRTPSLSSVVCAALWAPEAGIISPYLAAIRLAEAAVLNGMHISFNTEVKQIAQRSDEDGYSLRCRIDSEREEGRNDVVARSVVVAAGIGASTLWNSAHGWDAKGRGSDHPDAIHITPRRGAYFVIDPAASLDIHTVLFPTPSEKGKGVVVCPTADGGYLVGPGAQAVDDPGDTATDAEELDAIWEQAQRMVPGLRKNDIIAQFAGIRATPEGKDFIVSESKEMPGLFVAAGIESPGLTAAPAIALKLIGLLRTSGFALSEPIPCIATGAAHDGLFSDFLQRRAEFLDAALSQENLDSTSLDRIMCRCEKVTERQMVEALLGPVPAADLDGIKKRTRAGMGRCQGGFCTPRVVELMKRYGLDGFTHISKKGVGSALFTGPVRT